MFDIKQTLEALAVERMMFHSEADFQHALAVKIAQLYPTAAIRLEVPLVIDQTRHSSGYTSNNRGTDHRH